MNGLTAVAFLACVAMAFADVYQGDYQGSCGEDGIYSNGHDSLTFCSGGVASVQRCAPGTRHSYKADKGAYGYGRGLCDVKNDYGYFPSYPGYHNGYYGYPGYGGYAAPFYGAPYYGHPGYFPH